MEKFNSAVIGVGGMGKVHAEAQLASPYIDQVYVVDPNTELTSRLQQELGVIPASLEQVLADPSIRFVSIVTPNEFHVAQSEACLRAGKAVLCEKPMGNTLAEAQHIMAVEKETGGFLQIGFELHYSKMYQLAKDWITAGLIGTPVNIQTRYYCCEFHRRNNWRSNSTGSFLIGEKLSHYLDLQRFFFDDHFASIYSLSAPKVVSYFHHRDNHQITTKFANGGVGVLNFIMYLGETDYEDVSRDPLRDLTEKQLDDGHFLTYHILGNKGAIETDVFKRRIRRWEFGEIESGFTSKIVETVRYGREQEQEYIHNVFGQTIAVIENFATGKASAMTARDAYETMAMCFAAEMSEDSGKIITPSDILRS